MMFVVKSKLVLEVSNSRQHHCDPVFISRRDHFFVSHGTTGLNDRGNAVFGCFVQAIAKRKEGV